jgi:hypothetical protein
MKNKFSLYFASLCVFLVACGGGTTGTSPTDSLKFSGFAADANNQRLAGLSMTVRSGTSERDLEQSGTDTSGDFSMRLPDSESSLIVDVTGIGAVTVKRQLSGPGTISTKLATTRDNTLEARDLFEARVNEGSLCEQLALASGDQILVTSSDLDKPCPVTIDIASRELSGADFKVTLSGVCGGALKNLATVSATNNDGVISSATVDIEPAVTAGCKELEISVTHPRNKDLNAVFLVD